MRFFIHKNIGIFSYIHMSKKNAKKKQSFFKTNYKNTIFHKIFIKIRRLHLQLYPQLLAIIYAYTNANFEKFIKNYIYLHNKLQVVANDEN